MKIRIPDVKSLFATLTMNAWCSGGSFPCANLGAGITSDSEIICNNHTLWRNITCYNYVGPGTRCSGLKQCAYPTTSLHRLVSRDCSDPYPGVTMPRHINKLCRKMILGFYTTIWLYNLTRDPDLLSKFRKQQINTNI